MTVVALAAGCYINTPPAAPVPELGVRVVLELNDQGRMALTRSLGPEVLLVSGRFVDGSDSAYRVAISSTQTLDRQRVPWGGETVSVSHEYVRRVSERRFSKPRTALFTLGLAAAVGVFIATRGLLGFGDTTPDPDECPPGGCPDTHRVPGNP
jgi:hypothetical protein